MTTLLKRKLKESTKLDFVPVIFANGADDDLPGLAAAFKNERVQYGSKIYNPGESIDILDERLAVSCNCIVVNGEMILPPAPSPGVIYPDPACITLPEEGREINLINCHFFMNHKGWDAA